jgi:hypothetical protein
MYMITFVLGFVEFRDLGSLAMVTLITNFT